MIFVTVGTHEQQFNRLIECVDHLKEKGIIDEEVIIQTGYSTYEPKHCKWSKLFSYNEMVNYVEKARIVMTHGGPASFIMPLQIGKIPIVIPRQSTYDEHVNNHQVDFVKVVAERQENIIPVYNVEELGSTICRYDMIVSKKSIEIKSNNLKFNIEFEKIVKECLI